MARATTRPKFARSNEKDLLRSATDSLPLDFPNPERIGCPDAGTLDAVAGRHLSIPNLDDVIDHIATCSPCFAIYTLYRKRYCSRKNRNRSITGAAVLVALMGTWLLVHPFLSRHRGDTTQIARVAPRTAVLDFRNRTSERSDQAQSPGPIEVPHLHRSVLNLQIRLPLGTEDGQYSVQFRNSSGGLATQTTGTARWDGAAETLFARIDLRRTDPGAYTVAIRKDGSSWRQYSVFVE